MTRFIFCLISAIAIPNVADAQRLSTDLQSLVDAEKNFAAMAKEFGTGMAFRSNFSSNALLLVDGEFVNAQEHFRKDKGSGGLIVWEPVFADVSFSGNFGYTTGPTRYFTSAQDTVPVGHGYYSSVWIKQTDEWKVLADIGINFDEPEVPTPPLQTSSIRPSPVNGHGVDKRRMQMLEQDRQYIRMIQSNGKSFEASFFSSQARIHRHRHHPMVGLPDIKTFLQSVDGSFDFEHANDSISGSGDLGYTIGKVTITYAADSGKMHPVVLTYLHIWKFDKRGGWKLVLDVIG